MIFQPLMGFSYSLEVYHSPQFFKSHFNILLCINNPIIFILFLLLQCPSFQICIEWKVLNLRESPFTTYTTPLIIIRKNIIFMFNTFGYFLAMENFWLS